MLKGTFLQSEFAADITAVHSGKAPHEYQDAAAFFDRTYITEGMRLLLTQVAQRLSGKGGEPVIQLQTSFGGGKTHTMLAVLHLATRKVPLSDLPGVPTLVEKAGLMDVPQARVGVIDGTAHAPGQPWKHGRTTVKTLWGELAWQLGGGDGYVSEGAKLPSETQEGRYCERLCRAYPIHPEVFDRLYEDWSTIDGFQRTRGVLKLMAKVISRLWKADNKDLLILPGSLPLADGDVRNEMTYLLPPGWDPVIEGDIDGDRAETTELEQKESRLGQVQAARRVARTLFLGTAPSCVATKPGIRGLDRARVLLGCLQPGQASALYADALDRLADRLHYLNSTGDKKDATTRYWFDTRANLRREMEDRKRRFDAKTDVRKRIEEVVKKLFANASLFDGVHTFTPHADVPDDSALRLVVLPPEQEYLREENRRAADAVLEYLRTHGNQPRHRANRLLFVAADAGVLSRLRDAARVALAWESIVEDVDEGRLNIDQNQRKQAEKEAKAVADVVPRAARECFKWLLCPVQDDPKATTPTVEAHTLNTMSGTVVSELERVCRENALIIETWSPIHLRAELKVHYWKADRPAVGALAFWEDTLRYLYLPRLKSREVLAAVIRTGGSSRDFFGTAYGQNGDKYDGFAFGDGNVSYNDTLLLIEPEAAKKYAIELKKLIEVKPPEGDGKSGTTSAAGPGPQPIEVGTTGKSGAGTVAPPKPKSFHGTVEVPAETAKARLVTIADEIIKLLASDPNTTIRVTVEIAAEYPHGASDTIRRGVSENAGQLGFKTKDWE